MKIKVRERPQSAIHKKSTDNLRSKTVLNEQYKVKKEV